MRFKIEIDLPEYMHNDILNNIKKQIECKEVISYKEKIYKNGQWIDSILGIIEDCSTKDSKLFYIVNVYPKYKFKFEKKNNATKCVF